MKLGGRVALQCDRLRNAQSFIDKVARMPQNTYLTCGICDAAVALECDPPASLMVF